MQQLRFDGVIAGLGTASGTRIVLGLWPRSPFGRLVDAMVEHPDGMRTLLAPTPDSARFIASTYRFDEVRVVPTALLAAGRHWRVQAGPLRVGFDLGRRTAAGWALWLVPRAVARSHWWCVAVGPAARLARPGVRTHGSAGNGRIEWYGALDEIAVRGARAEWAGRDLGTLRAVDPPVRFGFGSVPRRPALVRVTTTVRGDLSGV